MNELKYQNFKNEEIALDESALKSIRKMYFRSIETTNGQVNHIIRWFEQCLRETKKELANIFIYEEIKFLISSYTNPLEGTEEYSIKQYLILKMYSEYKHNEIPEYIENVNIYKFIRKLEKLSEFQSYVLTYIVMEFADKHTIYTKDDIIKSFDIK